MSSGAAPDAAAPDAAAESGAHAAAASALTNAHDAVQYMKRKMDDPKECASGATHVECAKALAGAWIAGDAAWACIKAHCDSVVESDPCARKFRAAVVRSRKGCKAPNDALFAELNRLSGAMSSLERRMEVHIRPKSRLGAMCRTVETEARARAAKRAKAEAGAGTQS
jgi:hypothetical protein